MCCFSRSLRRHRENHHSSSKDEKCLVSPASSVASSDLDEKSLGSESCDGSVKGTKLVFTGFNSPEKEKLLVDNDTRQFQLIEQIIRETKESEASNAKIQSVILPSTPVQTSTYQQSLSRSSSKSSQEGEPSRNMVECTICSRKFKNIPALNGHMRLHGGYYRKDNDKSKSQQEQKTTVTTEPISTHTVSSNVRALIEEKIIQKRKLEPTLVQRTPATPGQPLSPRYISLPSCSTSTLCSTSKSVTNLPEPPNKRIALEGRNNKSISSLDNLVFPVLPVPDTSKLLANLRAKQQAPLSPACILPASPLPNVPLPSNPVNNIKTAETQVKSAHLNNLLKINQRKDFSVGIGSAFQATLPTFRTMGEDSKYGAIPQESLMWSHRVEMFPESQLDSYLKLASSSAVKNYGNSAEQALYILLQCNGNIIKATQALLSSTKLEDRTGRPSWTAEEVDMFYEALCKHKKDFAKIAADLPNKSTKDCVEFYYLWKNICREESESFKSIINTATTNDAVVDANILASTM